MNRELAFYHNPRGPQRREILRELAARGVRKIGTDGFPWDPAKNPEEYTRFRAELAESGLTVQSMHAVQPLLAAADRDPPPDLLAAIEKDLARLVALDGRTVVYHACWMRDVPPERFDAAIDAAGWPQFAERCAAVVRRLARSVAAHGITIVLENIWHSTRARSITGFVEILERVGEPNVGFCLDSGHAHLAGVSVAAEILAAGPWLRDTHFHDNVGAVNGRLFDQHIPPGLGTIDWQAACRALNTIAYPGPVVFEGVLGPGDSIEGGRFGGALSHGDLIEITMRNWRAFEALALAP